MRFQDRLTIILFVIGLDLSLNCYAAPTVTVSVEANENYRSVLFTFVQNDIPSMEGCHYNLFAAGNKSALEKLPGNGRSIATFFRPLSFIQIVAHTPHVATEFGIVKRARRHVRVYFRVLLSCADAADGLGEIISVSLKTFPRGRLKSMGQITGRMKQSMSIK